VTVSRSDDSVMKMEVEREMARARAMGLPKPSG
jgi:hypothetical protein